MQNQVVFGRRGLATVAQPSPTRSSTAPAPASYAQAVDVMPSTSRLGAERVVAMLFSSQGRISRVHYCIQSLVTAVVYVVLVVVMNLSLHKTTAVLIGLPLAIAFLWCSVATHIKRWHDRDKSGWWCLILFIPIAGWVWGVIECRYLSGTRGPNRFGADPRSPIHLAEVFA